MDAAAQKDVASFGILKNLANMVVSPFRSAINLFKHDFLSEYSFERANPPFSIPYSFVVIVSGIAAVLGMQTGVIVAHASQPVLPEPPKILVQGAFGVKPVTLGTQKSVATLYGVSAGQPILAEVRRNPGMIVTPEKAEFANIAYSNELRTFRLKEEARKTKAALAGTFIGAATGGVTVLGCSIAGYIMAIRRCREMRAAMMAR